MSDKKNEHICSVSSVLVFQNEVTCSLNGTPTPKISCKQFFLFMSKSKQLLVNKFRSSIYTLRSPKMSKQQVQKQKPLAGDVRNRFRNTHWAKTCEAAQMQQKIAMKHKTLRKIRL